ncbi:hypothetical protein HGRIS_011086 [Hohenbuehelia grisea]|uniref:Uncharacterized protein n=1 Tax=Hohenbuehelia grisea TaxID=104357 RepID=A0ABR3IYU5_9AGAR
MPAAPSISGLDRGAAHEASLEPPIPSSGTSNTVSKLAPGSQTAVGGQKPPVARGSKPFKPNMTAQTPRAISGRRWGALNPAGTLAEFETFFKALSSDELASLKAEEKALKKKQKENRPPMGVPP